MNTTTTVRRPQSYRTPNGQPRHELFDSEARAEAQCWVDAGIKTSQVRRFYGQARADLRQIELAGDKADNEQARVAMAFLKASTAYAAAREKHRKALKDFATHHAGLVQTIDDFRLFLRHFEAVVAWHRLFEEENKPKGKKGKSDGARTSHPGASHRPHHGRNAR